MHGRFGYGKLSAMAITTRVLHFEHFRIEAESRDEAIDAAKALLSHLEDRGGTVTRAVIDNDLVSGWGADVHYRVEREDEIADGVPAYTY